MSDSVVYFEVLLLIPNSVAQWRIRCWWRRSFQVALFLQVPSVGRIRWILPVRINGYVWKLLNDNNSCYLGEWQDANYTMIVIKAWSRQLSRGFGAAPLQVQSYNYPRLIDSVKARDWRCNEWFCDGSMGIKFVVGPRFSPSLQTLQEFGLELAAIEHLAAEAPSLNESQTEGLWRIYNKNNETQIEGAPFKRLIK